MAELGIDRDDPVRAVPTSVSNALAITGACDGAICLVVERSTARRAVVHRGGRTGPLLAAEDGAVPGPPELAGLIISASPARRRHPEDAVEHLCLRALPFLSFLGPALGHAWAVHLDRRGRMVVVDVETGEAVAETSRPFSADGARWSSRQPR